LPWPRRSPQAAAPCAGWSRIGEYTQHVEERFAGRSAGIDRLLGRLERARQAQADALRETIIAEQEKRWKGDLLARIAEDRSALRRETVALLRSMVPMPWVEFVQGILRAEDDALDKAASIKDEAERDAAITEALEAALRTETGRLQAAVLRDDEARLADLLGAQAAALTDVERRFLAISAAESTARGASDRIAPAPDRASRGRERQVARLPFAPAGVPEFGDMVRGYTDASKRLGAGVLPSTAQVAIASWLARLPNPAALHPIPPQRASRRRAALHAISEARNAVAHAKRGTDGTPMPAPPLAPHWQALVADKDDAFFRYFPKLFATPEPLAP
jgi:hypothetical protein